MLRPLSVITESSGRSGAPRSRARSSGRFRRLQSWASTMRKLPTWDYVAADNTNHDGELEKAPRTPEGRQIRARFPAKRPRTRGVAALERSGAQAAGSWQQAAGFKRPAGRRAPGARPLAPFAPTRSPFAPSSPAFSFSDRFDCNFVRNGCCAGASGAVE